MNILRDISYNRDDQLVVEDNVLLLVPSTVELHLVNRFSDQMC